MTPTSRRISIVAFLLICLSPVPFAFTRLQGRRQSPDLARFQKECALARSLYRTSPAKSLALLSGWASDPRFRPTALSTELTLLSTNNRVAAREVIREMSAEPYGFSQFNLARFAFFPPYAAVTQADHLEPLRLEALRYCLRADPRAYVLKAAPERKDKANVFPISVLITAAGAYGRMGKFDSEAVCCRRMVGLAKEIRGKELRDQWTETANTYLKDALAHTPPSRQLMPESW